MIFRNFFRNPFSVFSRVPNQLDDVFVIFIYKSKSFDVTFDAPVHADFSNGFRGVNFCPLNLCFIFDPISVISVIVRSLDAVCKSKLDSKQELLTICCNSDPVKFYLLERHVL